MKTPATHDQKDSLAIANCAADAQTTSEIVTPTAANGLRTVINSVRGKNQRGMTTAEYAIGTVAAVSFGGILWKIISDPAVSDFLLQLFLTILRWILTLTGIGA